ncbi:hypothetical protein ACLB2K_008498 [Fragaria x ananassa]
MAASMEDNYPNAIVLKAEEAIPLLIEGAIEVVTGCGIFGKGNTIAVLGSLQGIKTVKKIVEDCIAHDVPPTPRVRRIKKKTQPKKDARIKMTSQVMMNACLECTCAMDTYAADEQESQAQKASKANKN